MQKLLIVLAIQFCLPWAAMLWQVTLPVELPWRFWVAVGLMNTVCLSCAVSLQWPRWWSVFLTLLVLLLYWGLWHEVALKRSPNIDTANYSLGYFRYYCGTGLLAGSFALILFYRQQVIWRPNFPMFQRESTAWQFNLTDLIYFTAVLALAVGIVAVLYREHHLEDNSAGALFRLLDFWMIALTMTGGYYLLQRSIPWLSLAVAVFILSMLWLVKDLVLPTRDASLGSWIYLGSCLGFGGLSIMLYRFAGFRLVSRDNLTTSSVGQLSCKNC